MRLAVVGAGLAGVSAAFRAARAGHSVSVVHGGAGASELYSGALDLAPWESAPEHEPLPASVLELGAALGWVLSAERSALVVTRSALVRRARGRDRAVLDVSPLAGRRIGVVDVERDDWDGLLIARTLGDAPWALATGTRFESVSVPALKSGAERRISSYDFARLHDAPERVDFLAAALARVSAGFDAWLTGPWLGVEQDFVERLARQLGVPVGETLSPPGGPAGARFEGSRARLFRELGITALEDRALRLARRGSEWHLELQRSPAIVADAAILAVGGVAAGGVRLNGSLSGAPERDFTLNLEAPIELELDGQQLESSSLFGLDLAARGLGLLERIGVRASEQGAVPGAPGLFAAGDVVAGRPRTALGAVVQGLRAAESALSRG